MSSSNNTTSGNNQTKTLDGFLFESPEWCRALQQLAAEQQPPPVEAVLPANGTAGSTSFLQGFGESINTSWLPAIATPGTATPQGLGQGTNNNGVTEHVNPPPPRPRRGRPRSAKVLAAVNLETATRRGLAESTNNNGVMEHVNPAPSQPRHTRPSPTSVSVGRCGDIPSRPLYQRTTSNKREFYASTSSAVTHTSPGKLASSSNYVPEMMRQVQQEKPPNHNRKRPKDVTAEEIDEQLRKRRYPDNGIYDPLYQAFGQHVDPFFRSLQKIKELEKAKQNSVQGQKQGEDPNNGSENQ